LPSFYHSLTAGGFFRKGTQQDVITAWLNWGAHFQSQQFAGTTFCRCSTPFVMPERMSKKRSDLSW
jgi:hypothetical protein